MRARSRRRRCTSGCRRGGWSLSAHANALADGVLRSRPAAEQASVDGTAPAALPAPVASALREAALVDAQQIVLFREVLTDQVDLATVYLPGLDILGTKLRALGGEQSSTALLVESAEAVRRYYEWLLEQIADTAASGGPARPGATREDLAVVLVGHPGRSGAHAPAVLSTYPLSLGGRPVPDALPSTTTGTLLDVAPAVLQALGVPLSNELTGQAIWLVRPPSGRAPSAQGGTAAGAPRPVRVPSYGKRGTGPLLATGPDTLDEEMRERLRSLGYVR